MELMHSSVIKYELQSGLSMRTESIIILSPGQGDMSWLHHISHYSSVMSATKIILQLLMILIQNVKVRTTHTIT